MKIQILLVILIAFAFLFAGCTLPKACTEEAKICPDGTVVVRNSALNCEFDPCPALPQNEKFCEKDSDCACGVHKTTEKCFFGNKVFVDTTKQCPDFCTGIAGNFSLKCVKNNCANVSSIACAKEGETIPVVQNPPSCCEGLSLIPPKQEMILGISGICTAKCSDGNCNEETESIYNCPADCNSQVD